MTSKVNCEYCKKEFRKRYNYNGHIVTCKEKQNYELIQSSNNIEELKTLILKLQKDLEEKDLIILQKDQFIDKLLKHH